MHSREKILMILVTRKRPARALEAYEAWQQSIVDNVVHQVLPDPTGLLDPLTLRKTGRYSDFMVAFDEDDDCYTQEMFPNAIMSRMKPAHLVPALNMRAIHFAQQYAAIGNIGDDHIIRTKNWDKMMLDRLDEIGGEGILYPDDLLARENLATAVVVSSGIIGALGYMGLPEVDHMYVDNAWMELGRGIGKLEYMPEIVMEHMHPAANKAPMDTQYDYANTTYTHDLAGIQEWRNSGRREFDIKTAKMVTKNRVD